MNNLKIFTLMSVFAAMLISCQQGGDSAANNTKASSEISEPVRAKGQSTVQDDESEKNILHIALGSKDHTTLVAGVKATNMEDVLTNAGPLTVFAPNNAAFDKLPEGTLENLLKEDNLPTLAKIIKGHAHPGTMAVDKMRDGMRVFVASGDNLVISHVDGKPTINGANILGTVKASNGLVHVIDKVLVPEG